MAIQVSCTSCGSDMPVGWDEGLPTDVEPVCPDCAAAHFTKKSRRRRYTSLLLEMYGIEAQPEDIEQLAKKPPKETAGD